MNPILAGFLPLIITSGLASIALVAVGAFSYLFLLRVARGEFELDDETEDE